MTSKTTTVTGNRLGQVLSGYQWGEHHSGIVDASVDQVWVAVHQLRWSDLGWLRPVVALRGITAMVGADTPMLQTFTSHGAVAHEEPPSMTMFALVGKPWSVVPQSRRVDTLDQVQAFDEPGWLKYGMEWVLHPLPDGRTVVETRTLCEATDRSAERMFRLYWTLIRGFSGLLRREMIAALGRRTSSGTGRDAG